VEELEREKRAAQRLAEENESVGAIGRIISSTLEIENVYDDSPRKWVAHPL